MKIHEVEVIDENAAYVAYRRAVPGGWLYCERIIEATGQSIACERVPDPTAEHVIHGAGGAAATANYGAAVGYSKAIADCLEILTRPRASHSDCVEKIGALRWER